MLSQTVLSGKLEEFEIKYTFGFKPIQQYLVQLPKGKVTGSSSDLGL